MKKTSILTLILGLFVLTLTLAAAQGSGMMQSLEWNGISPALLQPVMAVSGGLFERLFTGLAGFLGQSLFWSVIAIALLVELALLYPSAAIQLKQKKIHLFHKKLVDRFQSGELALSKTKQELSVLYAVNEKLHRLGALLFMIQLVVLVWVILGLQHVAMIRPASWSALSQFDLMLFQKPASFLLPFSVALAYFLHSVVKIVLKQKEDYIHPWQSRLSLFIALLLSALVFTFSSVMSVLLSVYLIQLITFSTLRYVVVEWKAKAWGKAAHRELIKMLMHAPAASKNAFHKWRAKLNHSVLARHFNLHLLEEAASMSLVVGLVVMAF